MSAHVVAPLLAPYCYMHHGGMRWCSSLQGLLCATPKALALVHWRLGRHWWTWPFLPHAACAGIKSDKTAMGYAE